MLNELASVRGNHIRRHRARQDETHGRPKTALVRLNAAKLINSDGQAREKRRGAAIFDALGRTFIAVTPFLLDGACAKLAKVDGTVGIRGCSDFLCILSLFVSLSSQYQHPLCSIEF